MRITSLLALSLIAVSIAGLLTTAPPHTVRAARALASAEPGSRTAGYEVWLDPTTGAFGAPRAGARAVTPPRTAAAPTAALEEVPSPVRGMMVELDDRYASYMGATRDAHGATVVECATGGVHASCAPDRRRE